MKLTIAPHPQIEVERVTILDCFLQHCRCIINVLLEKDQLGFHDPRNRHFDNKFLNPDSHFCQMIKFDMRPFYYVGEGVGDDRHVNIIYKRPPSLPCFTLISPDCSRMRSPSRTAVLPTLNFSASSRSGGSLSPGLSFFAYISSRIWSEISSKARFS